MNTDNPQQTVSDFELGWLVGIIEGEGSITLQISKRARMQSLRVEPRVIITNTDPALIEGVLGILDKMGVGKWVVHKKPNNPTHGRLVNASYKDITYIHVSGFKRVGKLLNVCASMMVGEKKLRAEVLSKFVSHRVATGGKNSSYTQEDVASMLEFLRLTRTKKYEQVAGMLNEHTRDGRKRQETIAKFSAARKAWWDRRRVEMPKMCSDLT